MTKAQWSKLKIEMNVIMVLERLPGRVQWSWLHVKKFTACSLITKCLGHFTAGRSNYMIALHYGLWGWFPRWTTPMLASFIVYTVVSFSRVLHVLHLVRNPASSTLQPCQGLDLLVFVQKPTLSTSAEVMDFHAKEVAQSQSLGINR